MLSTEDIREAITLLNSCKIQDVLNDEVLNSGLQANHVEGVQDAIKQSIPLQHLLTDNDLIKRISIMHLKMKGLYEKE